jgi:adenosyl cobinamide kinase/adenosyl cobinamide phosphate guanylyltransferase
VAKITFLLGLAGSGKSFLAEKLRKETGAEIFEGTEGDEIKKQRMLKHLTNGESCIVEEIAYCLPSMREAIVSNLCSVVSDIEIEWICFENDMESANWNVMNRKNKNDIQGHFDINKFWHPRYIYPSGAEVRPIHRIDENNTTA